LASLENNNPTWSRRHNISTDSHLVTTTQHFNWQPLGHDGTTFQLTATWSWRHNISTDSHLVTTAQHFNWQPLGHNGTPSQQGAIWSRRYNISPERHLVTTAQHFNWEPLMFRICDKIAAVSFELQICSLNNRKHDYQQTLFQGVQRMDNNTLPIKAIMSRTK